MLSGGCQSLMCKACAKSRVAKVVRLRRAALGKGGSLTPVTAPSWARLLHCWCMALEIDIGFTSTAGKREANEDFAAALLPEPGREAMGAIAAIADGVSTGGMGREAAQTTVTSLVRDYFGTPETWDTTVALDRIIAAQNSWHAGLNSRRQPVSGLTTLTAVVLRGQSYSLAHVGDTRAYLLRGGEMTQLTHDHAMDHPDLSHQLLRAVGAEE